MNKMIQISKNVYVLKRSDTQYDVFAKNTNYLGIFEMLEDGCLYYWPANVAGAWSSYLLREVSDLLDHLNDIQS